MAINHYGRMKPPCPEGICLWISVFRGSNNGEGLQPSLWACVASQEHLVSHCVRQSAGLLWFNPAGLLCLKKGTTVAHCVFCCYLKIEEHHNTVNKSFLFTSCANIEQK